MFGRPRFWEDGWPDCNVKWLDAFWIGSARRMTFVLLLSLFVDLWRNLLPSSPVLPERSLSLSGIVLTVPINSAICVCLLFILFVVCRLLHHLLPPPLTIMRIIQQHKVTPGFLLSGSLICLPQHRKFCWSHIRLPLTYCCSLCPLNPILH